MHYSTFVVLFKIPGATQADLTIRAQRPQCYICRVNDHSHCTFTEWAQVKVLDTDLVLGRRHCYQLCISHLLPQSISCGIECSYLSFQTLSGVPLQWQGEPHIAVNPKPQTLRPGDKLILRCAAFGIPKPENYQWYRNGVLLQDKRSDTLQVGIMLQSLRVTLTIRVTTTEQNPEYK